MDLKNKLSLSDLLQNKNQFKKIYFYRICGTGMGAAACLLKEKGYEVAGGDTNFYPPMSTYLEETKIKLDHLDDKFEWDSLKDYDLIVVGNVVPKMSSEAREIEDSGTPFCSFPALLGGLVLHDINVVGVAGTHGKTTTTYFLTQIFQKLGCDPGYFIGGVLDGMQSSHLGDGKYFFIESDEYDSSYFEKFSKFRSYTLNHMILTSLEFDHADIFDDTEDIKDEFRSVLDGHTGLIIANSDYNAVDELMIEYRKNNWLSYGYKSDFGPKIVSQTDKGSEFKLRHEGRELVFKTNIVGEHNILNLSSALLYALSVGYTDGELNDAIAELNFVKRRQEVRGRYKEALVIDDFAHHPRSVACTVSAIKTKYHDKKIVAVLEPNSATARSNIFQEEFTESLYEVDHVIFAKPERATSVKSAKNLDFDLIKKHLAPKNVKADIATSLEELRGFINGAVDSNTVLLVMSNGTCLGLWKSDFVHEIINE